MATRLSPEDYRLLDELNRGGGIARISDGRSRHGADRLVDAGLASSRSLNISDVEYEMTPLGRKAHVLRQHGIASTDVETIEPRRSDADGLWYVKVSCSGDPAVLITVGNAVSLVAHLRHAQAQDLADRFQEQTDRTRRFAGIAV
jgi:hypothetical protein